MHLLLHGVLTFTIQHNDVYFADGGAACIAGNLSTACESLAYSHDLSAYEFIPGMLSLDQISGGLLEILFRDDESDRPSEGFKITANDLLQPGTHLAAVPFSCGDIAGGLLASLQEDGLLRVVIARQYGDFIFDRSTFTVNGTRESDDEDPTTPPTIPEPTSLALFSTG